MSGFFITGTDTEIGKTYVSQSLISHLVSLGLQVSALKPIASGSEIEDGELRNEDALKLMSRTNVHLPYHRVNRYTFAPAIAPHIAAEESETVIDTKLIRQDLDEAMEVSDCCVVEGAGGWMVPLGPNLMLEDLVSTLDLPVILVVGIRLGCINHSLLTAEYIRRSGFELKGWVANECCPEVARSQEQISAIKERIGTPLLCNLEYEPDQVQAPKWNISLEK